MRKAAWPIPTLIFVAVSFVVGRKAGGFLLPPAVGAPSPRVRLSRLTRGAHESP